MLVKSKNAWPPTVVLSPRSTALADVATAQPARTAAVIRCLRIELELLVCHACPDEPDAWVRFLEAGCPGGGWAQRKCLPQGNGGGCECEHSALVRLRRF